MTEMRDVRLTPLDEQGQPVGETVRLPDLIHVYRTVVTEGGHRIYVTRCGLRVVVSNRPFVERPATLTAWHSEATCETCRTAKR